MRKEICQISVTLIVGLCIFTALLFWECGRRFSKKAFILGFSRRSLMKRWGLSRQNPRPSDKNWNCLTTIETVKQKMRLRTENICVYRHWLAKNYTYWNHWPKIETWGEIIRQIEIGLMKNETTKQTKKSASQNNTWDCQTKIEIASQKLRGSNKNWNQHIKIETVSQKLRLLDKNWDGQRKPSDAFLPFPAVHQPAATWLKEGGQESRCLET